MNRRNIFYIFVIVCLAACWSSFSMRLGEPTNAMAIQRGKELVQGLAACGACHGETNNPKAILSGGQIIKDRYGELVVPNITPDKTGIGDWTTNELVQTLRNGVARNSRKLSKDFHRGYEWMSDEDLLAIIAYLRTLPPVRTDHEMRELSFLDRNVAGFTHSWRVYDNFVPSIEPDQVVPYGRYLVDHVADCDSCHTQPDGWFSSGTYLGGGKLISGPSGERYAPGIANSEVDGVGSWSEDDLLIYLQTGRTPDGRLIDGDYCRFPFYSRAAETDLVAISRYIKSLP